MAFVVTIVIILKTMHQPIMSPLELLPHNHLLVAAIPPCLRWWLCIIGRLILVRRHVPGQMMPLPEAFVAYGAL